MSKHSLLSVLCMAFSLSAMPASAQNSVEKVPSLVRNIPMPFQDVLKNIQPTGTSCRNENFVAKPNGSASAPEKKANRACAVSLTQLSAFSEKFEVVLIDIRPKVEFDRMHIDGAVNLSASEIRAKHYLSNKFVVLLGDGKADEDLYELCDDLKDAGFKQTKVLRGGMLSWVLENKAVIGSSASFNDLASLSPGELFRESKIAENLVIRLPGAEKLADVLPATVNASSDNAEEIKALVQKSKKGKLVHNIVLVADARFDKSQLTELARAVKPQPLLVYVGSEDSYRQFLHTQKAMWDKQAKGPTRPRCGAL